jgi:hypothetical protein
MQTIDADAAIAAELWNLKDWPTYVAVNAHDKEQDELHGGIVRTDDHRLFQIKTTHDQQVMARELTEGPWHEVTAPDEGGGSASRGGGGGAAPISSVSRVSRVRNIGGFGGGSGAATQETWSAERVEEMVRMYDQIVRSRGETPLQQYYIDVLEEYLTTPDMTEREVSFPPDASEVDSNFTVLGIIVENVLNDRGLLPNGFWVDDPSAPNNHVRFANNNGPAFQTHRPLAMTLFNQAYEFMQAEVAKLGVGSVPGSERADIIARPASSFPPIRVKWTCPACTFENAPTRLSCEMCGGTDFG